MSYIGTPPSNAFTSLLKQDFTTSVTTGYTLDHAVNNANDIALFINFVRQEPTAGYAASGTTLTLTSATASSDDMYCVYLGQALQTVNPANASVGSSQLSPIAITGQTAEATIATDDTILIHDTSASALRKMTRANFVSGIGGTNTPAFSAKSLAATNASPNTATKVAYAAENFDSDGKYDTSTSRFTPTVVGKYFIKGAFRFGETADITGLKISIYKNGSAVRNHQQSNIHNETVSIVGIIDLDADDYVEIYFEHNHSGTSGTVNDDTYNTFEGFKLIT